MAHWAENQLFVYLSLSVQLLLFIFQIKVVQCFVDTGLLALVNCILDFGWHVTLYAQIRYFGMGKKRRRAWNGKGEPPRPDTNRTTKKTWPVCLVRLAVSALLQVRLPILCCFFYLFTYYESEVFGHQCEISFLPLSVFLSNCWLSKGIRTFAPCAFCPTLDACAAKWLCGCRHFCVCAQIFRDAPPTPISFLFHASLLQSPPLVSLEECCGFVVFDCDRPDSLSWCYMFDFRLVCFVKKNFFFF